MTVVATITADGKLESGADPAQLRRLFADDQVAEIHLTIRPLISGRRGAATLTGLPAEFFPASIRCRLLELHVQGCDCLLRYRVVRSRAKRAPKARAQGHPTRGGERFQSAGL